MSPRTDPLAYSARSDARLSLEERSLVDEPGAIIEVAPSRAHRYGLLTSGGLTVRLTAPSSPNMNAHAERVPGSIQEECTDNFWLFGERSLHGALAEYCYWYHHRPH